MTIRHKNAVEPTPHVRIAAVIHPVGETFTRAGRFTNRSRLSDHGLEAMPGAQIRLRSQTRTGDKNEEGQNARRKPIPQFSACVGAILPSIRSAPFCPPFAIDGPQSCGRYHTVNMLLRTAVDNGKQGGQEGLWESFPLPRKSR